MKLILLLLTLTTMLGQGLIIDPYRFGSSFSPTNVSGLKIWLDASDISTLFTNESCTVPVAADGDKVGGWLDKSGNGNHFTTGTDGYAGFRPTYKTGIQNGLSIVRFEGTVGFMEFMQTSNLCTAIFGAADPAEVFIVIKAASDPAVGGQTNGGLWTMGFSITGTSTSYPRSDGIVYDSFGSDVLHTVGNLATTLAQWNLYNSMSRTNDWVARLNGTQVFTSAASVPAWQQRVRLGKGSANNNNFFHGDIGEMLVYGGQLSSGDRTSIEDYLQAKWALP